MLQERKKNYVRLGHINDILECACARVFVRPYMCARACECGCAFVCVRMRLRVRLSLAAPKLPAAQGRLSGSKEGATRRKE